jgi:hypothetical protein
MHDPRSIATPQEIEALIRRNGLPIMRADEDGSSGEIEVTRSGFSTHSGTPRARGRITVYYFVKGEGMRPNAAQRAEKVLQMKRLAPLLRREYAVRVSPTGTSLSFPAQSRQTPRRATAKRNGAKAAPVERRYEVRVWDADKGYFRMVDTWAKGRSPADIRQQMANRYPDVPAHEIRVKLHPNSPNRPSSPKARGAKRNGRYRDLTADERATLRLYANRYGRTWKEKLRRAWSNDSRVSGTLKHLRNELGPSWLAGFRF